MKENVDVLIATPGNVFSNFFIKSLLDTTNELNRLGISFRWLNAYSPLVHEARELTLASSFLDNPNINSPLDNLINYKKIIFIDSDIVWKPEDFLNLYNSKFFIQSGVYYSPNSSEYSNISLKSNVYDDNLNNILIDSKEIFETAFVGLGFIAIKQGIFEKLERPWFTFVNVNFNFNNTNYSMPLGEDFTWCLRVRELGFTINVDPKIKVGHIKSIII